MSEEKIGVSQHNVSINISSNNARLVKYAREHLRGLARQPLAAPDIDVRCQWIEQEWQPEQNPFEGKRVQLLRQAHAGQEKRADLAQHIAHERSAASFPA